MTSPNFVQCEIRADLPATLEAAEAFVAEFRQRREFHLEQGQSFAVELLLREALTNAVHHGCHHDPAMQVHCSLRLRGSRALIVVVDDGNGFDWRGARDHPATFSDCSGRGIQILRKYGNRVRFNERGNAVTIIKRLC